MHRQAGLIALKVGAHRLNRGVAVGSQRRERLYRDAQQLAWNRGAFLGGERVDLASAFLPPEFLRIIRPGRSAQRQGMEERRAKAVHVARHVDALAAGLLRAHVERSAVDRRLVRAEAAGAAPVQHQHLAEIADQDVVRLDVLMDDALVVSVGDRIADVDEGADDGVEARDAGISARRRRCRDAFAQRASVDLAHAEVRTAAAGDIDVQNREHVGMLEFPR